MFMISITLVAMLLEGNLYQYSYNSQEFLVSNSMREIICYLKRLTRTSTLPKTHRLKVIFHILDVLFVHIYFHFFGVEKPRHECNKNRPLPFSVHRDCAHGAKRRAPSAPRAELNVYGNGAHFLNTAFQKLVKLDFFVLPYLFPERANGDALPACPAVLIVNFYFIPGYFTLRLHF